ncbi:A coat protein [Xanthomonas translucens]|uniref:A coat protein n=1 Tax=Xanthomonas campestris pv. translucens TaxID=343 RepID=UPI001F2ED59F|nr:A coat protein [Xanthomonas translucens]UJB13488.1 A coat protein [Xanthomonas translucens pv. undulosa]
MFAVLAQTCAMQSARAAVNEGEAYYLCNASGAKTVANSPNQFRNPNCSPVSGRRVFTGNIEQKFSDGWAQTTYGQWPWDEGQTCLSLNASQPPGDSGANLGQPPSTCYGGCKVAGTSISGEVGGIKTYGMVNRSYTGDVCSVTNNSNAPIDAQQEVNEQTKQKSPECVALDSGQTGCMKQNGDYCATASTGKTFCWKSTETGKKVDATDAQVKSIKGEPVTPPTVAITDQEWQRKEGHQQTACVNTTCATYNVTNYSSVPAGTSKNSTGDNSATGSGNTSGNGAPGKGSKDDDDDGDGDSASDSGNCTTPPACTGDTLKCLHLKFTWKTQCNTLRSEITKGDGCADADVPVCAGDSCKAADYASVLQQWKQRCAAQALGEGMATRAAGIANGDDAGVVAGIWGGESGGSGLTLRQDLVQVGGGGSLLPDVEIEGSHWTVPQGFYDAISAVRMVIIAMCTVIAMFVVGRNI